MAKNMGRINIERGFCRMTCVVIIPIFQVLKGDLEEKLDITAKLVVGKGKRSCFFFFCYLLPNSSSSSSIMLTSSSSIFLFFPLVILRDEGGVSIVDDLGDFFFGSVFCSSVSSNSTDKPKELLLL